MLLKIVGNVPREKSLKYQNCIIVVFKEWTKGKSHTFHKAREVDSKYRNAIVRYTEDRIIHKFD